MATIARYLTSRDTKATWDLLAIDMQMSDKSNMRATETKFFAPQ